MSNLEIQGFEALTEDSFDGSGALLRRFPSVTESLKRKSRARGQGFENCNTRSVASWYCTLPKGHPTWWPHIAGASNGVAGIWYDDKTLSEYSFEIDKPGAVIGGRLTVNSQRTTVQYARMYGRQYLPNLTPQARKLTGKTSCLIQEADTGLRCTAPAGHAKAVPHLAGAGPLVASIWYDTKTLKSFGMKEGDLSS